MIAIIWQDTFAICGVWNTIWNPQILTTKIPRLWFHKMYFYSQISWTNSYKWTIDDTTEAHPLKHIQTGTDAKIHTEQQFLTPVIRKTEMIWRYSIKLRSFIQMCLSIILIIYPHIYGNRDFFIARQERTSSVWGSDHWRWVGFLQTWKKPLSATQQRFFDWNNHKNFNLRAVRNHT